MALLTRTRNVWNGDSLALKLCQGKEENLKFTDTHKTVRKWFCNPVARHLPGKGESCIG